MDIRAHNRRAWDLEVGRGNEWTVPVTPEQVAQARKGDLRIYLAPKKPVPREWFPPLSGAEVLCLASGGGQQGPLLATAGARVTVYDNSPRQLEQDRIVAGREGLSIATVEGDMAHLSAFKDESFDLIVHPISNCFAPDIRPVWKEAFRVLRKGCALLAGFTNPAWYLFDDKLAEKTGELKAVHKIPYSDADSLSDSERERYIRDGYAFEFSHTLEDQIGGQLAAGFVLTGFFEDNYPETVNDPACRYMQMFIATRAIKPRQ